MDADGRNAAILDGAEQAPHAVDEGLAADEADVLMLLRLPQQMLARAEADLEPDLVDRNREEIRQLRGAGSLRLRRSRGKSSPIRRSFRALKGLPLRLP